MSFTGQDLSGFDEALRIDYLPVIRDQLENSTYLLKKLRKNERDVSGREWKLVAHYGRNSGVGAGSETGLPTAGQQSYKNPYGDVKYVRGRIQVSGPVMAAAKNDKGAIVRALESEIKGVTRDLEKEINYMLHNDGTAVRALVNGDPGTAGTETTITLDAPGTNYFHDGMKIDFLNPSDGAVRTAGDSLTVSTVDSSTQLTLSAVLSGTNTIADNDYVIREDATDHAGTSYEMMGIKGIIDDATYVTTLHNLSRSSYAWWKASTFTNDDNSGTNRDLTLDLIQDAITAVEKNGGKTNLILSNHDLRDAYAALVIADKRFVNTLDLDGGFKGLEYNGIPWVADVDCMPNTVFFIDTEHLEVMQMSSWDWMNKDGAVLSRVADADAYEAVLFWYADLATDRPRAHAFLRDVQ
jgi:hypothetical protein